jgi:SAM-dependent methyltransferase
MKRDMTPSCKICKNSTGNQTHKAREMMFGCGDEFVYIECKECGCLQIEKIPNDLSKYYPSDSYYSYSASSLSILDMIKIFLKGKRIKHTIWGKDLIGNFLNSIFGEVLEAAWLHRTHFQSHEIKILDVGCGSGNLILRLKSAGFSQVEGIDPFIVEDIHHKNGVKILKKFLHEVNEHYDFIMLNHSFEHMPDQLAALKEIYRLLKPGGTVLIRIPVASSYAWRTYGINWVQLDAPRHFYLHTEKSIRFLAMQSNLSLESIVYDSTEFQFWGSELYLRGKTLATEISTKNKYLRSLILKSKMKEYKRRSNELNEQDDGDQACFFLKKVC